jgi:uncharacterized protein (TIGR03437 family)
MWTGRFSEFSALGSTTILLFAALPSLLCAVDTYPSYTIASIVNSATQTASALAPNSIATIYGANLSFSTDSASVAAGATLPTIISGVSVLVNGHFAHLFYVSPGQINFLIPYELVPGTVTLEVARQGAAGPSVKIQLNSTSPGFFPWNGNLAIATHLTGVLISKDAPAKAGEIIVLFAAGLGRVTPDTTSGRLASSAAIIVAASQMQVTLSGTAVPTQNILYAGLAPGYAGLYQINLRLPDLLPADPEIRVGFGAQISPALIRLPATASAPAVVSPQPVLPQP